jgi:tetratricopeptide (TPR) repeat protein
MVGEPSLAAKIESTPDIKPVDRVRIKRMLKEARDLYAQGRLDAVEDVLRGVIEQDPQSPFAYHLLGTVFLERKEEERAFKVFSEAAHQFPDDAMLRYDLGFLYAQRGLGPLARDELNRALRLQPSGGLAARARAFLATGTVGRPSGPPPLAPDDLPTDGLGGRPQAPPTEPRLRRTFLPGGRVIEPPSEQGPPGTSVEATGERRASTLGAEEESVDGSIQPKENPLP